MTPGVGCGVLFQRRGTILLLKRRRPPEAGHWSLVGGKVDPFERGEDAARREAREESGLVLGSLSLLGVSEQLMPEEAQHWVSLIFLAEDFEGEPLLAEPEKHAALGWFPLDDLPAPLGRAVPDALALWRARSGSDVALRDGPVPQRT